MKKNFYTIFEQKLMNRDQEFLESYAGVRGLTLGETSEGTTISAEDAREQLHSAQETFYSVMTGMDYEGKALESRPDLTYNEATSTADLSIVIPRVYSMVLQEPREPNLFLQNVIAEPIPLPADSPQFIEFPIVSAINAHNMAEGQSYEAEMFGVTQQRVSLRLEKIGVMISLTEEIVQRSIWSLVTMCLRFMGNAIRRKTEANLFAALTKGANATFDNNNANSLYFTSGVNLQQNWNASFSYYDLVKLCQVLLSHRYNATHFLAHPLSWPIFALDPLMQAQFMNGGQLGQGIWNRTPSWDQQANIPFGITYVPYYAIPFLQNYTYTGSSSAIALGSQSLVSDVYVLDKENSLYLGTRGNIEMDQQMDWYKDAHSLKARYYAGAAIKDLGRGMVKAANVSVVRNREPVTVVGTVAV